MTFTAPLIRLKPKTAREIRAGLPLPLRVLTSPKTTIALGATLATILFPAAIGRIALGAGKFIVKKPKTALLGIPTAAGILAVSPKARKLIDPRETFKRGKGLGGIIEDPSKLRLPKDKTLKEKVIEVGKTAGLIGGAAAAVVGGAAVVKKIKEKIPSVRQPTGTLPAPPSITAITQPLGAVEKPKGAISKPITPTIKINNNPTIDIRFSKSRRFINQQILVKTNGRGRRKKRRR